MTRAVRAFDVPTITRRSALRLIGESAFLYGLIAPATLVKSAPDADENLRAQLQQWLKQIVDKGWVSGGSVLVMHGRSQPLLVTWGQADMEAQIPVTSETMFRIYSMTKPITAVAMMSLVEQGKVRLDQPIAEFLPEFARPRVFLRFDGKDAVTEPARTPITVRHLLTHTAGLSESFNDGIEPTARLYKQAGLVAGQWYRLGTIDSLAEFSRCVAQIPLAAQPGTRWIYGTSFDIAGRVIEVASGIDFGEYVARYVLEPLQMRNTTFQINAQQRLRLAALYREGQQGLARVPAELIPAWGVDKVIPTGGAGLFSTLTDYARFARMLMQSGELDGTRVLTRNSVDQMMTDQLGDRMGPEPLSAAARFGLGGEVKGLGFGLGGSIMRASSLADGLDSQGEYAWGGAASTTFWVNRRRQLAVVLMTQKLPSGIHPLRDELRQIVYRATA